jgi:hypothetical protein
MPSRDEAVAAAAVEAAALFVQRGVDNSIERGTREPGDPGRARCRAPQARCRWGARANSSRAALAPSTKLGSSVKKAHPDLGGTAEQFRALVIARDRLLASLGTSEPPPKMPSFYPSGVQVRYRSARRSGHRLGYTRRLGHAAD